MKPRPPCDFGAVVLVAIGLDLAGRWIDLGDIVGVILSTPVKFIANSWYTAVSVEPPVLAVALAGVGMVMSAILLNSTEGR